jgi:phosphate transport system substrate-binding protein
MKTGLRSLILSVAMLSLAVPCFAEGGTYTENRTKIVIEGSTTVLPVAQAAAETFMRQNPTIDITVRGGGSGVGIASLIDKTCDIGDASRQIKDAELDKATSNGVSPQAHVVAMDGICVIVNPVNPISSISKKQIKDIFTGKVSDWSQVGGSGGKIVVLSRDSSSGTFEAFGTLALDGAKVRPDALMQASNQAIASTVARTPAAIGYIGLGYVTNEVKALEINGVKPSKETVLMGTYPFSRPLFMYTNGKPQGVVRDFIDFVKSSEGQKIAEEQGYVALR